jgi:hypothetical protein
MKTKTILIIAGILAALYVMKQMKTGTGAVPSVIPPSTSGARGASYPSTAQRI